MKLLKVVKKNDSSVIAEEDFGDINVAILLSGFSDKPEADFQIRMQGIQTGGLKEAKQSLKFLNDQVRNLEKAIKWAEAKISGNKK